MCHYYLAFLEDLRDFPQVPELGSGGVTLQTSLSKFKARVLQGKKGSKEGDEMKTKMNPEEDWLLISWLSLQIASPRTVTLLTPGLIRIRFRCTAPAGLHLHGIHSQWWQPAAHVRQVVWEPAK